MGEVKQQTAKTPSTPPSLWQGFMGMDYDDMRFGAFFMAIMVYAIWGTPTPEIIGVPEIITGGLLIFATGLMRIRGIFQNTETVIWRRAAQLLFIIILPLPLIVSLFHGNAPALMMRDVIPFLYLLLPLFLYDLMRKKEGYKTFLTIIIAGMGLIFALRVLSPLLLAANFTHWSLPQPADPFYLANAPTVLFAGIFFIGMAGFEIYRADTRFAIPYAFFLLFLGFFPLAAMALILQRASMGMVVISILFLLCFSFYRRPERALLPFLTVVMVVALGWDMFEQVLDSLVHKTSVVGMNMRMQEAWAVIGEIQGSFWTVVFGKGWGATFTSPAVGGVTVNFTHNLLTTYWLKTGLVGLSLACVYLYDIGRKVFDMLFHLPVVGLAIFAPLMIDIFLYASFKSLDFGLVLLLGTLWADEVRRLKK